MARSGRGRSWGAEEDRQASGSRNQGRVCVLTERMTLLGHRFERRTAVGSKTGDASMDARLWLARNSRAADSGQCVRVPCVLCVRACTCCAGEATEWRVKI